MMKEFCGPHKILFSYVDNYGLWYWKASEDRHLRFYWSSIKKSFICTFEEFPVTDFSKISIEVAAKLIESKTPFIIKAKSTVNGVHGRLVYGSSDLQDDLILLQDEIFKMRDVPDDFLIP